MQVKSEVKTTTGLDGINLADEWKGVMIDLFIISIFIASMLILMKFCEENVILTTITIAD